MAQEKPGRLAEWIGIVRTQTPVVRRAVRDWFGAVRREPGLIWDSTAARVSMYVVGAAILLIGVGVIRAKLAPPVPPDAKAAATSADFHVVCSDPTCDHHFVIHREFGFHAFPVTCPRCEKMTGQQAQRCFSKTCEGRWVAPIEKNGGKVCPHCGRPLP